MKPNEPSDYEPPMNSNRRRPSGSNNQNNKPKINDLGRNVPNSNKPRSGVPSFKGPIRNNVNNGNKPNQIPRSQPHNKDYKQNSENNQNYYNQILNRGNKPNFEENNYNQNNFASNKPNEKFDNYYEDSYKPGLKGSNNDGSGNKFFTKKRFFLFLKIFAVCFIVGILAAVGIVYNAISSYNKSDLKLSDEQMALDNLTTSIYDENEELIQKLSNDSNKEFVSIDLIQPELQEAFIALEDERFKEHNGVDYFGFARGVITTILGSQSGGSTLTMQLVRNITQDKESTYKRKIIEMYRATEMEKSMSKKKILENYLNIIHMGADNDDKNGNGEVDEDEVPATVNGVKSAALRFYEKDISEGDKLTILECAVLAGITQTPNYYMPRDKENQKHILDKAKNVILPKMYEQGYITKAEYEKAKSETIEFKKGNLNIGKSTEQSYFVDAVIDQAAAELSEESGITEVAARSQVYKKGYKIYTTFDKSIQEKMDSVFLNEAKYFSSSLVEKSDEEKKDAAEGTSIFKGKNYVSTGTSDEDDLEYNVQAGMVIMDPNTGFVKALYGGRGKKDGIPSNYATGSTGNGIGSGGRMPGSSFKPVAAYAPALESGLINPGSVIDDVPVYYSRDKNVRYPKNYVADKHYGMLSAREAVATSNNVIAAKLFLQLKDKYKTEAVETLEKLNLYDSKTANAEATKKAREKNPDADEQDDYNNGSISIALGGHINSTPLKMAAAYCSFANKGVYNEPLFYTKIVDSRDKTIIDKTKSDKAQKTVVFSEQTAFLMTDMLKDVVENGTARGYNIINKNNQKITTAGKTGTSENYVDRWFVGYTPYYVGAVWIGDVDNIPLPSDSSKDHLNMWKDVMTAVHTDLEPKDFEKPGGVKKVTICKYSGMLPSSLCSSDPQGNAITKDYINEKYAPTEKCTVHVNVKYCIDAQNSYGKLYLAGSNCENIGTKVLRQRDDSLKGVLPKDLQYIIDLAFTAPTGVCPIHGGGVPPDNADLITPTPTDDKNTPDKNTKTPRTFPSITAEPTDGEITIEPTNGEVTAEPTDGNGRQFDDWLQDQ